MLLLRDELSTPVCGRVCPRFLIFSPIFILFIYFFDRAIWGKCNVLAPPLFPFSSDRSSRSIKDDFPSPSSQNNWRSAVSFLGYVACPLVSWSDRLSHLQSQRRSVQVGRLPVGLRSHAWSLFFSVLLLVFRGLSFLYSLLPTSLHGF